MRSGTNGSAFPRAFAAIAAAMFAAGALAGVARADDDDDDGGKPNRPHFSLTILHNNDGESKLTGAGLGALAQYGGIARFATVVDNLRRDALRRPAGKGHAPRRGVVMLSSGDNFLAGAEFNASLAKGPPFFDSTGLDMIGYDAMALGNHEFDFGPETLADFISGFESPTPFLSANLDFAGEPRLQALVRSGRSRCGRGGDDDDDDDDGGSRRRFCGPHIAPSTIVQEAGQRIGIVGATTPFLPFISSPRNVEVSADVAGAVQREIDRLRKQKVEIIILISHLQSVNEDLALAPMLRGLDVMIAGGGDELLANPGTPLVPGDAINPARPYPITGMLADGTTIPVVTTAGDYKYVGKLAVDFDRRGRIMAINSGPVRVSGNPADADAVAPDPEIQAAVVAPVAESIAALALNVVANSDVALDGARPNIREQETNLGNLMADALKWQGEQLAGSFGVPAPDIGIQNGGGIRNNSVIPAGPFTELHTFQIAAFGNFLSVVPGIPATQLKEILENAVSRVSANDGRWAQVSGMRFTWDAAGTAQVLDGSLNVATPGTRIREATLDNGTPIVTGGAVVPGAPSVAIATNDFSARGGDQYPFRGAPFTTLGVFYQQALLNYVSTPAGLNGLIRAADYPAGGEGRIVCIDSNGAGVGGDCPA